MLICVSTLIREFVPKIFHFDILKYFQWLIKKKFLSDYLMELAYQYNKFKSFYFFRGIFYQ